MKKFLLSAAVAVSAFVAMAPAQAIVVAEGDSGKVADPFSVIAGSQGILLASNTTSGTALTFAATLRSAVYLNSAGFLDFYYQVVNTGPGSNGNEMIDQLTVANFTGWTTDAYASATDPDGAGIFTAANNPGGSTTTFGRQSGVVRINFGSNGLTNGETSAVYVLRTNAYNFNRNGTFGIIDGSSLQGVVYAPAAGVPEPTTWGLMIGGFGLVGAAMRRTSKATKVVTA